MEEEVITAAGPCPPHDDNRATASAGQGPNNQSEETSSCTIPFAAAEDSSTVHTEYEAQHFGYTPTPLLNGMYNAVCDIYRNALKFFSQTCYEKYPTVMSEEELSKAGREVGKLIDRDVTEAFDVFEAYLMKNVFSIPETVLLPEDMCQLKLPNSSEKREEISTRAEHRKMELKQKITAVKYANAVLRKHLDDSKVLRSELQSLHNKMETSAVEANQVRDHLSYFSETLKNALRTDQGAGV